jgi:uncharacterized protein
VRDGDEEKGPNRTCIATRLVVPVAALIRFALDAEARLTPDVRAKLPGRGVWVTGTRVALAEAIRKKSFARSLKQPVVTPPDLLDQVDALLVADARQSLAMANKAGVVITGFAKVEAAIGKGNVSALVCANDGGEDGRRKILQAVKRNNHGEEAIPVFSSFASHELDLALGRENAIHAALMAGSACDAFVKRCLRLEKYRHSALTETGPDVDKNSASTGPLVLDDRQV